MLQSPFNILIIAYCIFLNNRFTAVYYRLMCVVLHFLWNSFHHLLFVQAIQIQGLYLAFPSMELNRPLLASYTFGSPEHAKKVNAVIHPQVKEDFRRWVKGKGDIAMVGMESAILLEAGFKQEVDFVVMVYAPLEVRVERAIRRDHSSRELIMKRIEAQMSDEVKRSHADFVIVNDDETPLIPQVLKFISLLSKNNHYLCSAKK